MSSYSRMVVRPPVRHVVQSDRTSDTVEVIMPAQYADRRSEPRLECDDCGALVLMPEGKVVTCRILDQSASGARVSVHDLDTVPDDLWLIDLDLNMARHGSAAWSTALRMGLRFAFAQQLKVGAPRPEKVPEVVYNAWLMLSGQTPEPDGVVYFD